MIAFDSNNPSKLSSKINDGYVGPNVQQSKS